MSDTSQETKKVILPRLKDKVMYVSTDDSTTKSETSYVISSSFKGILRLSPNNHNTTYEKPNIQLSLSDEKNLGTTYTDAIKFDSDTETAIKSEADITKRMIISSDSDGYVLGFRISENNFEFDKLGLPKPDMVIYLELPPKLSLSLVKSRSQSTGQKMDIHEKDTEYMAHCYDAALYSCDALGWERIKCYEGDKIRTIDDIFSEIKAKLEKL